MSACQPVKNGRFKNKNKGIGKRDVNLSFDFANLHVCIKAGRFFYASFRLAFLETSHLGLLTRNSARLHR